jgi:hypothetical protein
LDIGPPFKPKFYTDSMEPFWLIRRITQGGT